jgi:L-ascorbate metabolism protein UlaG (beta-lactamase superfamily)
MDPYGEGLGYAVPTLRADIVTISHEHSDHCNQDAVRGRSYKLICGPGEYEIGGVFVTGVTTYHDDKDGKERGKNVIYMVDFGDVNFLHLGDLGHVPTESQIGDFGDVDVLFAPVGGGPTINASQASEVVSMIEPRVVIPMHYKTDLFEHDLDSVEKFLKAMGTDEMEPLEFLRVNKSSLPEETQVVLLEYQQ